MYSYIVEYDTGYHLPQEGTVVATWDNYGQKEFMQSSSPNMTPKKFEQVLRRKYQRKDLRVRNVTKW